MTLVILRTIYLRVYPNEYIVFNDYGDEGVNHNAALVAGRRNFISKLRRSWSVDQNLFAWADKGRWKTDQAQGLQARQEGDRFRQGFEPMFVDFTKYGTLFVVLFLVEVSWRGYNSLRGLYVRLMTAVIVVKVGMSRTFRLPSLRFPVSAELPHSFGLWLTRMFRIPYSLRASATPPRSGPPSRASQY